MQLIAQYHIDIAFIQEPYCYKQNIVGITRGYKIFSAGSTRKRAAILITNRDIDSVLISHLSDEDSVLVEIVKDKLQFFISSMYLDSKKSITDDLRKIDDMIAYNTGVGLVIAMDSNARSSLWHDTVTNTRGKDMEEFLVSNNLYLLNEGNQGPTFENSQGKSRVDLTITTSHLLPILSQWNCGKEESCSDHKIITFNIGVSPTTYPESIFHTKKFIIKDDKLKNFEGYLVEELTQKYLQHTDIGNLREIDRNLAEKVQIETNTETLITEFETVLETSCNKAFKTQSHLNNRNNRKSVPWWTPALTAMRKKTNALRRVYQRTRGSEQVRELRRQQYCKVKKEYSTAIQKAKTQSWKQYCSLTPTNNPWNAVYKLASGKIRNNIPLTTLKKSDNTTTKDLMETATYMLEYFVPEDDQSQDTEYHKLIRSQTLRPNETVDDVAFTQTEIDNIIKNLPADKTPGENGVTGKLLRRVHSIFPNYLTALYNSCLKNACFPRLWKRAKILPIVKPGKENSMEVSKFRPISLLNTEGKVLEKLLINRINHHVFSNNLLSNNQYGFTPQKGTVNALLAVKNFIEESISQRQYVIMVSLDVQGAFDAAWWPSILNALQEFHCPRNLYNLAKNYFSDRTAVLAFNNISLERKVTKGCPQGSCCGPGFWNIQYNSLLNLNYTANTKTIAFADDLIVMTKAKTVAFAEENCNREMEIITAWAQNNKIRFNDQKSKAMLITRRRRKDKATINISLNNNVLQQVERLKYLGVIIDTKFTFNEHIQYVTDKCMKLIHSLSKSAKLNWGLGSGAMKIIYKGAILPTLAYAVPVWIHALKRKYNCTKIQRIQRLVNIKIAKAYRTTSSEALCILTGLTPIIIKLEEIAEEYKIIKIEHEDHSIDTPLDYKEWPHPANIVTLEENYEHREYPIEVYTDGSYTENGTGSGVAIIINGTPAYQLKYKLNKECTINQAEQLAILRALETLDNLQATNTEMAAVILTDSRVTLDSLKNFRNHKYLIEQIRNKIRGLRMKKWYINLEWTRAHVGTAGNELADKLAKKAAREDATTNYDRISPSVILRKLRCSSKAKWEREWAETTKGVITKEFFPTVQHRLSIKLPHSTNLTTMLTGHGKLMSYYHRLNLAPSATCTCAEGDQTVDHFLWECRELNNERDALKKSITEKGGSWPVDKPVLVKQYMKDFHKFCNAITFHSL